MKVLIIEDSENIIDVIGSAFEIGWPETDIVSAMTAAEGLNILEKESPDVVILDLGLPDMDGLDLLSQIRSQSSVPVLILTVRSSEADVVRGLNKGADDYVAKPFKQLELLARVKAITRRQKLQEEDLSVSLGPLRFGSSIKEIYHNNRMIKLTKTEGLVLLSLMKNADNIVSYDYLSRQVWHRYHKDTADILRVYIRRLRTKLGIDDNGPVEIISHPGIGYQLKVVKHLL